MAYRAWLDTVPRRRKLSRYEGFKAREDAGETVPALTLPEVPGTLAHLVRYLFEVGPVTGEHPVPFVELAAWCQATGTVLNAFEAGAIRTLSRTYLNTHRDALEPACPAPVMRMEGLPSKEAVSSSLGDFLRSFNTPQAKAETAKRQAKRRAAQEKAAA